MRIVTYKRIQNYIIGQSASKTALEEWYYKTKKAEWKNLSDVKNTFNTVDYVGNNRFVFNIKGNQYRFCYSDFSFPKSIYSIHRNTF